MISLSPLPPVHPNPFQRKPVRPSSACHGAFSLTGGRSQSFASAAADSFVLFGLAFAPGPGLQALTLAGDERLVGSLCKRHAVTPQGGSDRLQAHGFRYCFTPLLAVLFTFPSRYLYTIGLPGVLSLGGWCRRFRTGFLRPRPTQGTVWVAPGFRVRGCHPLRPAFPGMFRYPDAVRVDRPTTPRAPRRPRFGLFPFRSPLLGESLLFSFPPPT